MERFDLVQAPSKRFVITTRMDSSLIEQLMENSGKIKIQFAENQTNNALKVGDQTFSFSYNEEKGFQECYQQTLNKWTNIGDVQRKMLFQLHKLTDLGSRIKENTDRLQNEKHFIEVLGSNPKDGKKSTKKPLSSNSSVRTTKAPKMLVFPSTSRSKSSTASEKEENIPSPSLTSIEREKEGSGEKLPSSSIPLNLIEKITVDSIEDSSNSPPLPSSVIDPPPKEENIASALESSINAVPSIQIIQNTNSNNNNTTNNNSNNNGNIAATTTGKETIKTGMEKAENGKGNGLEKKGTGNQTTGGSAGNRRRSKSPETGKRPTRYFDKIHTFSDHSSIKQALIQLLAVKPAILTKISSNFPKAANSTLTEVLKLVSNFKSPGQYEMKKDFFKDVDPHFPDYNDEERSKVHEKLIAEGISIPPLPSSSVSSPPSISTVATIVPSSLPTPNASNITGQSTGGTNNPSQKVEEANETEEANDESSRDSQSSEKEQETKPKQAKKSSKRKAENENTIKEEPKKLKKEEKQKAPSSRSNKSIPASIEDPKAIHVERREEKTKEGKKSEGSDEIRIYQLKYEEYLNLRIELENSRELFESLGEKWKRATSEEERQYLSTQISDLYYQQNDKMQEKRNRYHKLKEEVKERKLVVQKIQINNRS